MSNVQDAAILAARELVSTPQWRDLMQHLHDRFGFTARTTLVADSPMQTGFNEGQRAMFHYLAQLPYRLTQPEMTEKGNG